jgi:inhibitor of cysteine peptidase
VALRVVSPRAAGRLARWLGAAALGLASLTGCEGLTDSQITGVLHVDSVDVLVLESFPVQITALVRGSLSDGCTEIVAITQSRSGNTVNVTIATSRPRDAFCTQLVRPVEESVRLTGAFPPGDYVVEVNGVAKPFRT